MTIDNIIRLMIAEEVGNNLVPEAGASRLSELVARLEPLIERAEVLYADAGLVRADSWRHSQDVETRRQALRPARVRVLFVSPPTSYSGDDSNFYLANSHLFRCIRGAFVEVFGTSVPTDREFLTFFRDKGCWLLHLPAEFRRRPGRPPKRTVPPDVGYLVRAIKDANPQYVVGTREPVRRPLSEAVQIVGMPLDSLFVARMPREFWTPAFAERLNAMLSSLSGEAHPEEAEKDEVLRAGAGG
jgi:hypothetical protein